MYTPANVIAETIIDQYPDTTEIRGWHIACAVSPEIDNIKGISHDHDGTVIMRRDGYTMRFETQSDYREDDSAYLAAWEFTLFEKDAEPITTFANSIRKGESAKDFITRIIETIADWAE